MRRWGREGGGGAVRTSLYSVKHYTEALAVPRRTSPDLRHQRSCFNFMGFDGVKRGDQ